MSYLHFARTSLCPFVPTLPSSPLSFVPLPSPPVPSPHTRVPSRPLPSPPPRSRPVPSSLFNPPPLSSPPPLPYRTFPFASPPVPSYLLPSPPTPPLGTYALLIMISGAFSGDLSWLPWSAPERTLQLRAAKGWKVYGKTWSAFSES